MRPNNRETIDIDEYSNILLFEIFHKQFKKNVRDNSSKHATPIQTTGPNQIDKRIGLCATSIIRFMISFGGGCPCGKIFNNVACSRKSKTK